jgi:hypothetical protein
MAAAAISSGWPRRLSGVAALKLSRIASAPSFVAACASMMGVSIAPGLIALTRMPRSLSSAVHECTNERTQPEYRSFPFSSLTLSHRADRDRGSSARLLERSSRVQCRCCRLLLPTLCLAIRTSFSSFPIQARPCQWIRGICAQRAIDFPIDALLATLLVPAIQVAHLSALGLFQTEVETAALRHR